MMRPAGPRHSPPDSLRRAKRPPALLGRRAPHAEAGQRVSRETSAAPPPRPRPGRPAARMAVAGSSLSSPPPTPCSRGATCQEGVLAPAPARRVLHVRHLAPCAPRRLPSGRGFARPASGRGPAPPVGRPLALARIRMFHVKHAPAPPPVAPSACSRSPPFASRPSHPLAPSSPPRPAPTATAPPRIRSSSAPRPPPRPAPDRYCSDPPASSRPRPACGLAARSAPPALLDRRAPHARAGQRVSRETSAAPPPRPRPGRPAARMAPRQSGGPSRWRACVCFM